MSKQNLLLEISHILWNRNLSEKDKETLLTARCITSKLKEEQCLVGPLELQFEPESDSRKI